MRLLFVLMIVSLACSNAAAGDLEADASAQPNDWPQYHRTHHGWRYSPLQQINRNTVSKLQVAWIHQPSDITNGLHLTPIVVDGIAYYSTPYNDIVALNASSGELIWQYRAEMDPVAFETALSGWNRGVTVGHGLVYAGTADGRFIAVDQATGELRWSQQITEPRKCHGCSFTSPPQLAGELLFGGSTGGDLATAGKIYAVDAKTGEPAWTFDTIRDHRDSWTPEAAKFGGGGAWMPGVYDPATDLIYIGTGNAAPDYDGVKRPGDNKYTASLLALEGKTGKLKWHYQEVPHDVWDFDSAYETVHLSKNGQEFIMHANKSGFVLVYDRATGAPRNVWELAENITVGSGYDLEKGDFIDRLEPRRGEETTFCPSPAGVRSWNHGAYNPKTGLWYINVMELCSRVRPVDQDPEQLSLMQPYFGADLFEFVPPPGGEPSTRLDARDPLTGERKWQVDYEMPILSSVLTTGGELVFNLDVKGILHAYDAHDGTDLWQFSIGKGSRGGLVSYAVDGRQYVLVVSGIGGFIPGQISGPWKGMAELFGGGVLVAFALPQ